MKFTVSTIVFLFFFLPFKVFPQFTSQMELVNDDLEWSTFLGGSDLDAILNFDVKENGEIIVVGITGSSDFPSTPGLYDPTHNGAQDWFVSCFNPDGSQLLWSTFIGGSDNDWIYDVEITESGDIVLAGMTFSSDFPTTPGAFDTTFEGWCEGVLVKMEADGTDLIYSTFLGGNNNEWILQLALNDSDLPIVGGYTASNDFPTTAGAFDESFNGVYDAFVTCMNENGTDLIYSTYIGGSSQEGNDVFADVTKLKYMGLDIHSSGDVIIGGTTKSNDFPVTTDAYDTTANGGRDGFVLRLNSTGSDLVYSTYLGGSNMESTDAIIVDEMGVVTVSGGTYSPNYPTTPGAYDSTYNGNTDVCLTVLNADGTDLLYSTFIGGNDYEFTNALEQVESGSIIITGWGGFGFPVTPQAYDTTYNGHANDMFLALFNPQGNGEDDLEYSTFLGTSETEQPTYGVKLINNTPGILNFVTGGYTSGADFPITPGAYDTTYNGSYDAVLFQFGLSIVSVDNDASNEIPMDFILSQNYPNPFNPSTTIQYAIKERSSVELVLYDILGREVKVLVNKEQDAGYFKINFNAGDLATGIYFYRLQAGSFVETKKMILLK